MNTILTGILQSQYSHEIKRILIQKVMSTNDLQKLVDCQQVSDVGIDWMRKGKVLDNSFSLAQFLLQQITVKNPNFFLEKFCTGWFVQLANEVSDFCDEPKGDEIFNLESCLSTLRFIAQTIDQLWKNAASKPPKVGEQFHQTIAPSFQKIMCFTFVDREPSEAAALFRIRLIVCQIILESPFLWHKKGSQQETDGQKEIAKSLNWSSKLVKWLAEIPYNLSPGEMDSAMFLLMKGLYLVWDNFVNDEVSKSLMEIFQLFLQEQSQKLSENSKNSTKFFDASFLVLHNVPISVFLPQTIKFFGSIVLAEQQKGLTAPENFCFHLGQVIIKMLNRYPLVQSVTSWIHRLLEFVLQHKGLTFVATLSMEAIPAILRQYHATIKQEHCYQPLEEGCFFLLEAFLLGYQKTDHLLLFSFDKLMSLFQEIVARAKSSSEIVAKTNDSNQLLFEQGSQDQLHHIKMMSSTPVLAIFSDATRSIATRKLTKQDVESHVIPSLLKFKDMLHLLMAIHTGHPELFVNVLAVMEQVETMLKNERSSSNFDSLQKKAKEFDWMTRLQQSEMKSPFYFASDIDSDDLLLTMDGVRSRKDSMLNQVGLINVGNTCYLNCFVQFLFHTLPLRHYLFSLPTTAFSLDKLLSENVVNGDNFFSTFKKQILGPLTIDKENPSLKKLIPLPGEKIGWELSSLCAFMQHTERYAVRPDKFINKITKNFKLGQQHDIHEFLVFVLDKIQKEFQSVQKEVLPKELPRTSVPVDVIDTIFGGKMNHKITCMKCGTVSARQESFSELSLYFEEEASNLHVNDMVSKMLKTEKLENENKYSCSVCNSLQDANKNSEIEKAPQYLIVALNRFAYDLKTFSRVKKMNPVQFDEYLELPVNFEESEPESGDVESMKTEETLPKKRRVSKNMKYQLYGVVIHSGNSAEHGHYYCFMRPSLVAASKVIPSDSWFMFNDSHVSGTSFAEFSKISSRFPRDVPYLLLYSSTTVVDPSNTSLSDLMQSVQLSTPAELEKIVAQDNQKLIQDQLNYRKKRAQLNVSRISSSQYNSYFRDDDEDGGGRNPHTDIPGVGGMNIPRMIF